MSFSTSKTPGPSKVFLTSWTTLEQRWDPNYYQYMTLFRIKIQSCPFPIEPLNSSLSLVQYGISERATAETVGTPMLRMANLQSDTWDVTNLKYIALNESDKAKYLLEPGDILFNRTNSKELVGKCCVFNIEGEYVFASYLIRIRLKQRTLLPDYVIAFLTSSLGRIQIDAISRQIAGMTNINAEEIRQLRIPIASEDIQREVVHVWRSAIQNRDRMRESARRVLINIDGVLLTKLGIKHAPQSPDKLAHRIFRGRFCYTTGARWDPLFHQTDVFGFIRHSTYPLTALGRLVRQLRTGFAIGRDGQVEAGNGIIQIRPTNINDDREFIFQRNVYVSSDEGSQRAQDLLKRGEVLFNNTNSQELVGKSAYFDFDGEYFCSNHITRIVTNPDIINPQYLWYLLNMYQRRRVFFKLCTNWNNQSGIGPDILQRIPVPLPSLQRQAEVVAKLDQLREDARILHKQAIMELEQAKHTIEALILGTETATCA
jgi:type I restriction enzyme S subunit